MEVKFGAGAVVDIVTGQELADAKGSLLDAITSSDDDNPIRFTQVGMVTGPSAPIDLGSPPIGRLWFILGLTLVGADAFTTVTGGFAALFVGDITNITLTQCRVPALTIPQYRTTSSNGMWVKSNESVFFVTSGLGAQQIVVASIQVEEYREADVTMSNPGFTPVK